MNEISYPLLRMHLGAALVALLAACKSEPDAAPGGAAGSSPESAANQLRPEGTPPSAAADSIQGSAGAAASAGDRPNLDEQMGRGFQGTLMVRVTRNGQSHDLRYLTRGNAGRLQIDALESGSRPKERGTHFDALIWDEHISRIDHRTRSVRTWTLDDVPERDEKAAEVKIEKTGERLSVHGVTCEAYRATQGDVSIETCVGSLPGTFDVDKLEWVSGIDVPSWVEQVIADEHLPLRGIARDTAGAERYSFELLEYSAGPVDDTQLSLPANYRVIEMRDEAVKVRGTPP